MEVEDIFEDETILKRTIVKGMSTSKAEDNSEIFLNYRIVDATTNQELYSSGPVDLDQVDEETRKELSNPATIKTSDKCVRLYLDEYRTSRMFKNVLKRMKKMERAEIRVKTFDFIKFGDDYEQLLKHPDILSRDPADLLYDVHVFFFVEGKNSFTMTLAEKMSHALRKKEIGLIRIKVGPLHFVSPL